LIFKLGGEALKRCSSRVKVFCVFRILRSRDEGCLVVTQGIPVDVRKPRMTPNLHSATLELVLGVGAKSLRGIETHKAVHQVFGLFRDLTDIVFRPVDLASKNIMKHLLRSVGMERRVSIQALKHDTSK
jgi:hypothetical protein